MVITYHGEGSFRLQNGDLSLMVDPPSNQFKANIILRTLLSTNIGEIAPQEIVFSGEYEISGVQILGVPLDSESTDKFLKTIYLASWDEVKLAFLGHISKMPSAEILDKIDEPDILFLPVGGEHFLSTEVAVKLVKQLEPAIAIPTFAKNPVEFAKALGGKVEPQEKFVFKKKDLTSLKNHILVFTT